MRRRLTMWAGLAVLLLAGHLLGTYKQSSVAAALPATAALPLFAYYYQCVDPGFWNRDKIDYPQLGGCFVDDPQIMREHVQEAKAAGVTGFIVSWRNTPADTRQLRVLAGVAAQQHISLAMIYQGLDFNSDPRSTSTVAADFVTFRDQFSGDPVFYRMGGKALTIWSGTSAYSHNDVATVTSAVRSTMLVLSTEESVAGYKRIADVTDGDADDRSSVNPAVDGATLEQMSTAVHADSKYWIAPFAPGVDGRLVGGSKSVPHDGGATLRTEYSAALESSPDALGLISWNEFSENTYVEPSRQHALRDLDVLTELRTTSAPSPSTTVDSSGTSPGAKSGPQRLNVVLLIGFPFALVLVVGVAARRRRRRDLPPQPTTPAGILPTEPQTRHRGQQ